MQLREKKVGPYTVRELSMRETMRVLAAQPEKADGEDDDEARQERGSALLGAAVTNGTGLPLGVAVLDVGASLYRELMRAHAEVNSTAEFEVPVPHGEQGDPGNG